MGGSSQPATTTTINKSEPPAYVAPYAKAYMQRAGDLSQRPYQAYTGQRVANFTPIQQLGMDLTEQRALQGNSTGNAANSMLTDTLHGNYLDPSSNPWLDATFQKGANAVMRNYQTSIAPQTDAAFSRAHAFGGSAWQQMVQNNQNTLAGQLDNLATDIYGGNYQQERARQMQAAGMAPAMGQMDYQDLSALLGIGDTQQQHDQANLNQAYQDWYNAKNWDQTQLDNLGRAVGLGSGGGGTTTTTAPNPYRSNRTANALGGALSGYGMFGPMGALGGGLLGLFM